MAGFMIAAPKSGSGKTIVTCGILNVLKRKGHSPFAYKCGPDYIDGLFHKRILEIDGGNLDSFFEEPEAMKKKYGKTAENHFPVVEGVMGYFDGLGGTSMQASAWEIAKILDIPAVLVVDAKGASLSLAALIKGFLEFGEGGGNHIQAVIFNRMSPMLYPRMKTVVEQETGIFCAGYLPELSFLNIGSRHLGLTLPGEILGLREQMEQLADTLEDTLDWEYLLSLGKDRRENMVSDKMSDEKSWKNCASEEKSSGNPVSLKPDFRLGVAMDEAFCFYYRDNLNLLSSLGAELIFFSPLHDSVLPEGLDGLLLGGGYPELHAKALSENETMKESLKKAVTQGLPVLAECGGYLYLLEELEGADEKSYPMAGVLEGKGYKKGKNGRFGYISIETETDSLYLKSGEQMRGHEFHYWDCLCEAGSYQMQAVKPIGGRSWPCIRTKYAVMAGFPHLYYPSCQEFAARFAAACRNWKKEKAGRKTDE